MLGKACRPLARKHGEGCSGRGCSKESDRVNCCSWQRVLRYVFLGLAGYSRSIRLCSLHLVGMFAGRDVASGGAPPLAEMLPSPSGGGGSDSPGPRVAKIRGKGLACVLVWVPRARVWARALWRKLWLALGNRSGRQQMRCVRLSCHPYVLHRPCGQALCWALGSERSG